METTSNLKQGVSQLPICGVGGLHLVVRNPLIPKIALFRISPSIPSLPSATSYCSGIEYLDST